jgi:hypothetical protein
MSHSFSKSKNPRPVRNDGRPASVETKPSVASTDYDDADHPKQLRLFHFGNDHSRTDGGGQEGISPALVAGSRAGRFKIAIDKSIVGPANWPA